MASTPQKNLTKGFAAAGGLMILLPIFLVLLVVFGLVLWAGFGVPGVIVAVVAALLVAGRLARRR